jgi:hypothetical protein
MAKKSSGDSVEKAGQTLVCSFCGKERDSKRKLISGIGDVYICNQCAAVCDAELNEQSDEPGGRLSDVFEAMTNDITVLTYKPIDDDDYIRFADEILPLSFQSAVTLESVKEAFKRKGWKDETEVGAFWLPPFFSEKKTSVGTIVWFAQDKKGLSYLGFEAGGLEYVKNAKWLVAQNKAAFE